MNDLATRADAVRAAAHEFDVDTPAARELVAAAIVLADMVSQLSRVSPDLTFPPA